MASSEMNELRELSDTKTDTKNKVKDGSNHRIDPNEPQAEIAKLREKNAELKNQIAQARGGVSDSTDARMLTDEQNRENDRHLQDHQMDVNNKIVINVQLLTANIDRLTLSDAFKRFVGEKPDNQLSYTQSKHQGEIYQAGDRNFQHTAEKVVKPSPKEQKNIAQDYGFESIDDLTKIPAVDASKLKLQKDAGVMPQVSSSDIITSGTRDGSGGIGELQYSTGFREGASSQIADKGNFQLQKDVQKIPPTLLTQQFLAEKAAQKVAAKTPTNQIAGR